MKHTLKLDAFALLLISIVFLIIEFTATGDTGGFLIPLVTVAMLVGLGFMEVDRRLCLLEKDKVEEEH